MTGEFFTIVKSDKDYKVFIGDAVGEPMDEPNEDQLYGWLINRGCSEEQASEIIQDVGEKASVKVTLP